MFLPYPWQPNKMIKICMQEVEAGLKAMEGLENMDESTVQLFPEQISPQEIMFVIRMDHTEAKLEQSGRKILKPFRPKNTICIFSQHS